MARRYFILASLVKGETQWALEFGDYSRAVVDQEARDMRESGSWERGTKLKVLAVPGDRQDHLTGAMDRLNSNGRA